MGRDETKTLSDESLGSERRFLSETSPSVFFDMIRWILPKSDRIGNYTVFNGALTTIRRNRTGTVYYDQIDGELAHCSVLGRNYNILILNEAVVNGGSYKLTRYGEDIFLDTQAATTKPTKIIPRPKSAIFICTDTHTTVSGRRCQHWDRDYPHRPNDYMRNRLGFTGHNFCAVADPNDSRPFCYTTDPNKRWDYCDCQPCNRTESGSQCLRWDSHYAHVLYR